MQVNFFIVKCGITRFLCACARYVCIRRLGNILTSQATRVPNFVSVAPTIAELACKENSVNHSLNHSVTYPASLMRRELKLLLRNILLPLFGGKFSPVILRVE